MPEDDSSALENTSPPLTPLTKPVSRVHLISTAAELSDVIGTLAEASGPIAIDAERASGFKYSQRAYLLQIKAKDSEIFLIDPTSDSQLVESEQFQQLRLLLAQHEWILHAATQDIPCLQELGLKPKSIFDTELAGRLAGEPKVGLGSLVEMHLGVGLAKEHSAADWSTRPLPESWLNYAALDVELLHDLRDKLLKILEQQGKTSWAEQEFEALLSFKQKPQKIDRWRGITGLSKIADQLSLEIARQLWEAREQLAIKMDLSPGRLVPDSAILAAAVAKPRTKPELASLKTFTGRASRSFLDYWWQAIQAAHKSTSLPPVRAERTEAIPNHRNWAAKFPEADRRLRHARNALAEISKANKLPLENLLTPDILRQICFAPPQPATLETVREVLSTLGARGWQLDLTADSITESINRLDEPDPKPKTHQE